MYILKYQGFSGHIAAVRAWSHGAELLVLRTSTFITFTRDYVWYLKYYIILNVVSLHRCTYSSDIIMHLYISFGFYAFQSVFFAVIYDLWIIHSSYFIYGFGAGNKMIDLCSHIGIVQVVINYLLFYRYILCSTMAMPFNMILILYVIPCKLSCHFSKLAILYIHVHIFYHFYA